MGRVNSSEPQKVHHFSHPHPLNLINYQQTLTLPSSCSACNLNPSGMIYSCTICSFFLHKTCFEMPIKITHSYHKDHCLTLLPKPDYPDGLFKCDGCGETGHGFSYNCKPCGTDLHLLCAAMPSYVTHMSHQHQLDLTFEPPYDSKDFCCDICKANGYNHWLYRCNFCGFDAHLNCANSTVEAQKPIDNSMGFQSQTSSSRSAPQAQTGFEPMQQNLMHNPAMIINAALGVPAGIGPFVGNGVQNSAVDMQAAIQQMIDSRNAMAQAILTAGTQRGQQQFMNLTSGINNGGGGGAMAGINAIGGGGMAGINAIGGGGQNALQAALMNGGGGGGGIDLVQSLIGGGNGGGGGGLAGSGVINLLGGALGSLL